MPITNTNHPNPFLSEGPEILSANLLPINIPAIEIPVNIKMTVQLYSNCFKLNKKPNKELMPTIINDVPTAVFIGSFKKSIRAGMIRKPLPAPNKLVTTPINKPNNTNGKTLLCLSVSDNFSFI